VYRTAETAHFTLPNHHLLVFPLTNMHFGRRGSMHRQPSIDPDTQKLISGTSVTLGSMVTKASSEPDNALYKSATALWSIFLLFKTRGAPYQVNLFSEKVDMFAAEFDNVFASGEALDEAAYQRGLIHYEELAGELQSISIRMSLPKKENPLPIRSALAEITSAITCVRRDLENDRREA